MDYGPVISAVDLGFEMLPPGSARLERLQADGLNVVDALVESLDDLFRMELPFVTPGAPEYERTKDRYLDTFWSGGDVSGHGVWAYFPWRNTLVHLPDSDTFLRLRTNRNRELITEVEQQKYYESRVAVAGLSVGLSCATAIVLTGGSHELRLADFDTLSVSNLNRIAASVCDVGVPKSMLAIRKLTELNPFVSIQCWSDGLSVEVINDFLGDGGEKVDVYVEEIDDISIKIRSRLAARERGIPVVMATDNGDNAILDVERFDLEPGRPLFHGSVPEDLLTSVSSDPTPGQRVALANAIVGSCVTNRTQESLQQIGTRLVTWPQLGSAASISGAAVAYIVRRITTGAEMPSGRYYVDLDACLDPSFGSTEWQKDREAHTTEFETAIDLMFGKP